MNPKGLLREEETMRVRTLCHVRIVNHDNGSGGSATYSKNPRGAWAPISFSGATALSADDDTVLAAGAKAEAEAARRVRTAAVFMVAVECSASN